MVTFCFLFLVLFVGFFDSFYLLFCILGWGVCFSLSGVGGMFGGFYFVDFLSFFLIFLSIWVFVYCFLSNFIESWFSNRSLGFVFVLSFINFFVFLGLSCVNFFLFYFCFEFIFLLMFIYLLGWGLSGERLQASYYMVFYTLLVSFPFLVYLILAEKGVGTSSFLIGWSCGDLWWFFVFCVFLVKLPVYGVHLWLPKAHVEAPVSGSMVLAGVLLKLGGYGVVRFMVFFPVVFSTFAGYFISIGLVGGVWSCLICLRQVDLKAFVAYSSVCHMGVGLAGMVGGLSLGWLGGILMMVGHGFCSSCLFFLLYVFYERFHSRSLVFVKGSVSVIPLISFVWFFFSVLNMGCPPFLSFFSEVLICMSVGGWGVLSLGWLGFFFWGGGFYGIYLFVVSNHGVSFLGSYFYGLEVREWLIFYGHFFPLLFFSVYLGLLF